MNWITRLYFAEGPGIEKDAPKPTGLRLLLAVLGREWWALIKLNLLFIAFALPLVTIPAAWFALVSVSVTMIEDRNVWVFRDFWAAFRSRFLPATAIGVVSAAAGGLVYLAVTTYGAAAVDNVVFAAPLALSVTLALALPVFVSGLFVALALGGDKSPLALVKAAALALLARPLASLAALGFVAAIWLLHIAFYPASALLPVLVNFSLSALVLSFAAHEGVRFGFSQTPNGPRLGTPGSPNTRSA